MPEFAMHYPDEINPEISFTPARGPRITGTEWFEDDNEITDEMGDSRLVIYAKGHPIDEWKLLFFALPYNDVLQLRAFRRAARGRTFRMTHPIMGDFLTVQKADGGRRARRYVHAVPEESQDMPADGLPAPHDTFDEFLHVRVVD